MRSGEKFPHTNGERRLEIDLRGERAAAQNGAMGCDLFRSVIAGGVPRLGPPTEVDDRRVGERLPDLVGIVRTALPIGKQVEPELPVPARRQSTPASGERGVQDVLIPPARARAKGPGDREATLLDAFGPPGVEVDQHHARIEVATLGAAVPGGEALQEAVLGGEKDVAADRLLPKGEEIASDEKIGVEVEHPGNVQGKARVREQSGVGGGNRTGSAWRGEGFELPEVDG